jgi:hypothetical protein
MKKSKSEVVAPIPQRRWAGINEAATYGAVGLTKLWAMMKRGDVFAIRNGRKVLVDLSSIDEFYMRCPPIADPSGETDLNKIGLSGMDIIEGLGRGAAGAASRGNAPGHDGDRPTYQEPALGTLEGGF